jgi:hypothetical protein
MTGSCTVDDKSLKLDKEFFGPSGTLPSFEREMLKKSILSDFDVCNHATRLDVASLLPLTQHYQTMFGNRLSKLVSRFTVTSTTAVANSI